MPYRAERHLFSATNQSGRDGRGSPASYRREKCSTRTWVKAAKVATSVAFVAASYTRFSIVPKAGEGRMSQRTSSKPSMTPVRTMSSV